MSDQPQKWRHADIVELERRLSAALERLDIRENADGSSSDYIDRLQRERDSLALRLEQLQSQREVDASLDAKLTDNVRGHWERRIKELESRLQAALDWLDGDDMESAVLSLDAAAHLREILTGSVVEKLCPVCRRPETEPCHRCEGE